MAVKIRLARGGSKKRPYYRIVVADSRAPRDGKYIEKIGWYNPMLPKTDENRIKFDADRAKYWLENGAQPTDRVTKFLSDAELVAKKEITKQTKKHLPSEKTLAKIKEKEEKKKAIEEAAKAEKEAAKEAKAEKEVVAENNEESKSEEKSLEDKS